MQQQESYVAGRHCKERAVSAEQPLPHPAPASWELDGAGRCRSGARVHSLQCTCRAGVRAIGTSCHSLPALHARCEQFVHAGDNWQLAAARSGMHGAGSLSCVRHTHTCAAVRATAVAAAVFVHAHCNGARCWLSAPQQCICCAVLHCLAGPQALARVLEWPAVAACGRRTRPALTNERQLLLRLQSKPSSWRATASTSRRRRPPLCRRQQRSACG